MHFITAMSFIAIALHSPLQEGYSTEWNKKSVLNTDGRIEFPGVVLEPGTYVIRVKESGEKRSIVEIRNQNEKQILATLLAVTDHRQRPDDNSELVYFNATPRGPLAVRTWFYTGDLTGLE